MKSKISYEYIVNLLSESLAFSTQKEAITYIAKLLNLGETTVYNKFNGRSHFTIEELFLVCKSTNVSLDKMLHHGSPQKSLVPYFSDGLKYKPRSYNDFLNNIITYYAQIKKLKNVKGYFLASEVPLFHFLFFPNLFYLKMYIWNKLNWSMEIYGSDYKPEDFIHSPENMHSINILKELFYSFPAEEIWNPSMIDITVSQFIYLKEMNIITNKSQMENIEKELNELLIYLENISNTGLKKLGKGKGGMPCEVYITDLSLSSELILVRSDDVNMMFQQLDAPNYIRTTDEKMCSYIWDYFNKIKQRSTLITKAGEKDKILFFRRMKNQLSRLTGE